MVAWRGRREVGTGRERGGKWHHGGLDGQQKLSREQEGNSGEAVAAWRRNGVSGDRQENKWEQKNGGWEEGKAEGGATAIVTCAVCTRCPQH